jgi:enoyl-CoA hydratase/carnithine racemase
MVPSCSWYILYSLTIIIQVFFGAALPPTAFAIMNYKLLSPQAVRKTALEGHRWTPSELLEAGVADELVEGGKGIVLKAAHALAEKQAPLAKTGLFGLMKKDLMKRVMDAAQKDDRLLQPADAAALARTRL